MPVPPATKSLFLGSIIHCIRQDELEYLHNTAICVDTNGKIVAIQQSCNQSLAESLIYPRLNWTPSEVTVHRAQEGQFFCPGFIDTHTHASQYANAGMFGKSTLMDWLETYTFPMESSLSTPQKAQVVYKRCIQRGISHGTTTACYFATICTETTNLLASLCLQHGQRAFVGRVCMDRMSPDWYRDKSPSSAVEGTKECIKAISALDPQRELVSPIITPRFAPTCSGELLAGLGELQKETALPVQTHVSENEEEIKLVRELFPECENYTDVYERHGLLGPKTILAHAVHLSEEEKELVRRTGAKISHCPCSNTAITSGRAKVRDWMNRGIDVGLGTDVSGGYSTSILEAARQASLVSRHVAMEEDDKAKLSVEETLYLATRGGAKVVGLEGKVGGFEVGMEWDAQLIGLGSVEEEGKGLDLPVDIFDWETWEERIAKWVFGGDDRNTLAVWVKGRLVHQRDEAR